MLHATPQCTCFNRHGKVFFRFGIDTIVPCQRQVRSDAEATYTAHLLKLMILGLTAHLVHESNIGFIVTLYVSHAKKYVNMSSDHPSSFQTHTSIRTGDLICRNWSCRNSRLRFNAARNSPKPKPALHNCFAQARHAESACRNGLPGLPGLLPAKL